MLWVFSKFLVLKTLFLSIVFACMYVCEPQMCSAHKDGKRASDPVELDLQKVVRHHVGTGNGTNWSSFVCVTGWAVVVHTFKS